MARYVLVEFADNDEARRFVEKVNGGYGAKPDDGRRRVRGVWGMPTKFCECTTADKGSMPYTRGERSGWWVHATCGRPSRAWARGNHWFSALGRNLLPGNGDYMPRGWGVSDADEVITPVGSSDAEGVDMARIAKKARTRARKEHPRVGSI